jgi:hypothetical protein
LPDYWNPREPCRNAGLNVYKARHEYDVGFCVAEQMKESVHIEAKTEGPPELDQDVSRATRTPKGDLIDINTDTPMPVSNIYRSLREIWKGNKAMPPTRSQRCG